MAHPTTRRLTLLAAAGALGIASFTACGGSDAAKEPTALGSAAPLFDSLPADYQESKKIVVGADIAYAPMEYYDTDGSTVLGFDKELTDLLAEQLGVTFEWTNATFDGLITQLKSDRIDIVVSGMSDTPERQQEIDFVDYYVAGAMILVQKGNPEAVGSLEELCGRTIAVQRGTTQAGYAEKQSAACQEAGGKPIQILDFDRETEAMLQIKNGRAVAGLQDYPVATYNARTSGGGNDFEVAGEQIEAGPLGIGVAKDDTALRDAIAAALEAVIEDGRYAELVEEYDVPLGAVESVEINGG
jgi:polar amino acid transport system substrate-binding protein